MKFPAMFKILGSRYPFEIIGSVIGSYSIDMINFVSGWRFAMKCPADQAVNGNNLFPLFAAVNKPDVRITVPQDTSCKYLLGCCAPPSFRRTDTPHRGDFIELFPSDNRQPLFFHGGMLSQEIA